MTHGTKYELSFYNYIGEHIFARIQERDYTGSVEQLTGSKNPVIYGIEGEDEKFDTIKASYVELEVWSTTDFKFLNLFTSDALKYKVQLLRRNDNTLVETIFWQGFIEPDIYSEPYIQPPYLVKIRAVDGLVRLKQVKFDMPYGYSGIVKQLDVLLWCLNQCNLNINLNIICNLYELRMTQSGSPFSQAYNHIEVFEDKKTDTNLFKYIYVNGVLTVVLNEKPFEFDNCYNIIKKLIKKYGCYLFQYEGTWLIIRLNERGLTLPTTDQYTCFGANIPGINYSHFKWHTLANVAKNNLVRMMYKDCTMMILPAWKKFNIAQDFLIKESILTNYDFKKVTIKNNYWYDTEGNLRNYIQYIPDSWIFNRNGALAEFYYSAVMDWEAAIIKNDLSAELSWPDHMSYIDNQRISLESSDLILNVNITYFPFVNDVRDPGMIGNCRFQIVLQNTGHGIYYLQSDYSWSTSIYTWFVAYDRPPTWPPLPQISWQTLNIVSQATPYAGDLTVRVYAPDNYGANMALKKINVKILQESILDVLSTDTIETLINDYNNYIPDDIELNIGDIPDIADTERIYDGGILLSDGSATYTWQELNSNFQSQLLLILAKNIAYQHETGSQQLQGTIKGNIDFLTSFIDGNNSDRIFIWSKFQLSLKYNEMNGRLFELLGYRGENNIQTLGTQADEILELESGEIIPV